MTSVDKKLNFSALNKDLEKFFCNYETMFKSSKNDEVSGPKFTKVYVGNLGGRLLAGNLHTWWRGVSVMKCQFSPR